ncbi:MAG: rod shape-determining protein MreC [Burkholderiaceae bacterium]
MDRSPPPFFNQGPSAHARLIFFAALAIVLLVIDSRFGTLATFRQGLGSALYPLQRTLLLPRDVLTFSLEYTGEINRLREENLELRRIEAVNAKTLLQAEQLAAENARLRELFGVRERTAVKSVMAEVLYDARDPFSRKIVLDKGMHHGLLPGQPVLDAKGVVGQVTRVFSHSSEVTLLTDRGSTIPVEVQRTSLRSVAYGAGAGAMELRYLSASTEVRPADLLVTSGLDGIYPPGLPVARVRQIDRTGTSSSFSRILLEPVAGVDQAKMVLVLLVDKSTLPPPPPPPPEPAGAAAARKRAIEAAEEGR